MKQVNILHGITLILLVGSGIHSSLQAAIEQKIQDQTKVFHYKEDMPIKLEETEDGTSTQKPNDQEDTTAASSGANTTEDPEAKCWRTIKSLTKSVFDRQRESLGELEAELKQVNATEKITKQVSEIAKSMRENMKEAEDALDDSEPERYFDALFDTSEDIMKLSTVLRDEIDDETFFALIKGLSKLGRNNAMLVQELMSSCSARNIIRDTKDDRPKPE